MWDARIKWFELGVQLDIGVVELQVIKQDHPEGVESCFREMLLTWLKMINPQPSWEIMVTALEHDSVKHGDLAESIRMKFGMQQLKKPNLVLETRSPNQKRVKSPKMPAKIDSGMSS